MDTGTAIFVTVIGAGIGLGIWAKSRQSGGNSNAQQSAPACLELHTCCGRCRSPRVAIARPISAGGKPIHDCVFAQIGALQPGQHELTCLNCGNIWTETLA